MKIPPPITGGCACGAIRYESAARPFMMFYCHCRDCQQAGGGPFTAGILFLTKTFHLTRGMPKYFSTPSMAGGLHTRGFCPECGSRLLGAVKEDRPFVGVTATSLDDPSLFKPTAHFFVSDAQPWDHLDDDLDKFEFYPPEVK